MANRSVDTDLFTFQIRLNPTIVFRFLVTVIVLLFVTSLALTTLVYVVEPSWFPFWHLGFFLFDLDEVHNVHGWYEASLLLIAGLLLAGIGSGYLRGGRRWFGLGWCWLAAGFLLLSLDVAAARMNLEHSIASPSGPPLADLLPVIFVLGLLPFVKALPAETKRDLVIAALVMGFGAVALDLVADRLYSGEVRPFSSRVVSNLEEAVELLGAVMVIRIALVYIQKYCLEIAVGTHQATE